MSTDERPADEASAQATEAQATEAQATHAHADATPVPASEAGRAPAVETADAAAPVASEPEPEPAPAPAPEGAPAVAYPAAAFAPTPPQFAAPAATPAFIAPTPDYAAPAAPAAPDTERTSAPVDAPLVPHEASSGPYHYQALTPPKKRSNRGPGTLISLIATAVFAVVYAAVSGVILAFNVSGTQTASILGHFVASPAYYVPVIFFALALILTVLIVNRAGWWAYVLGGFLIGAVVYGASILGSIVTVQAWTFTQENAATFVRSLVMDPLTLAAGLVAREVPVWVGAWLAARGRKLKARNQTERDEYDRKVAESATAFAPPVAPAVSYQ